jgi:hypothetical protein
MTTRLRGKLGALIGGVYTVAADDAHVYVRFAADGSSAGVSGGISTARVAHHGRCPPIPDLAVWLEREPDGWVVAGVDADGDASAALPGVELAAHTHDRYSASAYLSDDRLRLKLHVKRPDAGLVAAVNAGVYLRDGVPTWFGGAALDLTPYRPITAGHHAWCVLGIDPAAGALTAVSGASQPLALTLLPDQIAAVPFDWLTRIPICAVQLRHGMTTLDEADFEALLHTVQVGGASINLNALLSDDNGDLLTDDDGSPLWEG